MAYKIEKLPNGKYKIRVWSKLDIFGKKKSKQISNISGITTATKLAKELELQINDNYLQEDFQFNPDIKLSQLEQLYYNEREKKISPTTLHNSFKQNREKILAYFGNLKVRNINTYVVQKFIDEQQETTKYKKKTIKNFVGYLQAVINWGVNNNFVEYNRIKKLNYIDDEEEFEATTLSIEQITEILPKMKKEYYNIYIPSLITILTSARRGEVLGLRWEDLDFENHTISFVKNKITAGGKTEVRNKLKTTKSKRINPMADFLKDELIEHKKFCYQNSNQVCSNVFIGEISPDYLTHTLHDFILKEFNIDMREHDLRHTFSQLIEDNEDIIIAKSEMMGHSNLITTKAVYTRPSFVRKMRIANILGEMLREAMCAKKCAITKN